MLSPGRGEDNLFADFRAPALRYFADNRIAWWRSPKHDSAHGPTRLLRSSQIACLNHLWPAREDPDLALRIARNVLPRARAVLDLDGGCIGFEWLGKNRYDERGRDRYLGEKGSGIRGSNTTSVDAYFVVELGRGRRCAVIVEWKYTEGTKSGSVLISKHKTSRLEIYRSLLEDPGCPIRVDRLEDLFYDPFLQLARQTLLAWQICKHEEPDEWRHIHVVPAGNVKMRSRSGPPGPTGSTMSKAWQSTLRKPARYRCLTPGELMVGTTEQARWSTWRRYLAIRYAT